MHAGEVDTSLVLHLAPQLARMEAVRDNMPSREAVRRFRAGRRPRPEDAHPPVFGRASAASPETGARIYARLVDRIATRVLGVVTDAAPAASTA